MKKHLLSTLSLLVLFGVGCSGAVEPPAPAPAPSPEAPVSPTRGASGCSHPYYPLNVGHEIAYRMTMGADASDLTVKVIPSEEAGFHKLQYTFQVRGTATPMFQEFTCAGGSLRARGQIDFSSVMAGSPFTFETESAEGEYLPADLTVGKKWETTFKSVMHTENPTMKAMVDGKRQTTTIKNEVVAEESVTVPAGTYPALKVKQDVTVVSEMMPTRPITASSYVWFVRDVGFVKTESLGGGSRTTMEATRVTP
jgi:hypothetical protein